MSAVSRALRSCGRAVRGPGVAAWTLALLLLTGLPAQVRAGVDAPPNLAERQRQGLDLRQPQLLALEWSTPDTPAQVDAASALLARHGFTVERSRLRAPGGQSLGHVLRARRVGTVSQAWLDTVATALAPLVAGQGELRWALAPATETSTR